MLILSITSYIVNCRGLNWRRISGWGAAEAALTILTSSTFCGVNTWNARSTWTNTTFASIGAILCPAIFHIMYSINNYVGILIVGMKISKVTDAIPYSHREGYECGWLEIACSFRAETLWIKLTRVWKRLWISIHISDGNENVNTLRQNPTVICVVNYEMLQLKMIHQP
jgi:hypothetical protein